MGRRTPSTACDGVSLTTIVAETAPLALREPPQRVLPWLDSPRSRHQWWITPTMPWWSVLEGLVFVLPWVSLSTASRQRASPSCSLHAPTLSQLRVVSTLL